MPRRTTTGTTNSNEALYAFDTARRAEHGTVCGVDEAGRGPLCGPVCCAAVILNPDDPIEGVNDSKKLTEKRRDALYEEITKRALAYKIIFISPQEIDERNILWATMDGMAQAVAGSILAKVSRDRYMLELDKQYPQYQLARHKGYPTKLHYELIAQYGIQPFYRRSFLKKQGYWHD